MPAERELSELIGVTRTTLREVLQRLARDGWKTIQHGKPTKVKNFWELPLWIKYSRNFGVA
ncbi:MAG: GntR family transcriptional regulator [Rheinheimera sp.]|nr:GntR family transcriptional regulator [Rheinheimera sp.]